MARRTKEESLETRERLLDAALEVFHARGVSTPSLSDIAERAGVTRGAVYVHFENKADLFTALCDRNFLPMDACAAGDPAGSPLRRLHALCLHQMRQTVRDPRYRRMSEILFRRFEHNEPNQAIVELTLSRRARCMEARRAMLREAVERGELPADLDVTRATAYLHASVMGLLRESLYPDTELDLDRDAEGLVETLMDTLRTARALRRGA